MATGLLSQVVLVASGIVLARGLGPSGRGEFAILTLVPSVVASIGTLGAPLGVTYHVARRLDDPPALLRRLPRVAVTQAIVLTAISAGILLRVAGGDERRLIWLAAGVVPVLVAQQYGLAYLQAAQRFLAFNLLRVAPAFLYAILAGALAVAGHARLDPLLVAWLLTNVGTGVVLAWILLRAGAAPGNTTREARLRPVLRFGAVAFLGSASPVEVLRLDQAVVALALSRTALGTYVVALAFTNLPRFISQSLGMVAYPRVASSVATGRAGMVRQYLTLVLLAAGVVVVLLEASVGWVVPWVFGADFTAAVTPARILLVAALLLAIRRVLADLAQGLGHPSAGTVAEAVNLVAVLPLILVLAPRWGITGAAGALVIGASVSLLWIGIAVGRRVRGE